MFQAGLPPNDHMQVILVFEGCLVIQKMNSEELKQFLETQRNRISDEEFFSLVIDMLGNKTTRETREILESYLVTYSHIDEDRVTRYLAQFLDNADTHMLTFVLPEIGKLARKPDSLAERILGEYADKAIARLHESGIWEEAEKVYLAEKAETEMLEQNLEARERELSQKEFFELVLGMLEKDPPKATREVLKRYLLINALVDEDRVARYLEQFLSDPDPMKRELAADDLVFFAHDPNSLAYKILTNYLGEEPTADNKWKIMARRFIDLFPRQDGEETNPE